MRLTQGFVELVFLRSAAFSPAPLPQEPSTLCVFILDRHRLLYTCVWSRAVRPEMPWLARPTCLVPRSSSMVDPPHPRPPPPPPRPPPALHRCTSAPAAVLPSAWPDTHITPGLLTGPHHAAASSPISHLVSLRDVTLSERECACDSRRPPRNHHVYNA